MVLVVDAYNVLKQIAKLPHIEEKQRVQFLQQLGRYAKLKGHAIIVVFDGGPYDREFKESAYGLQVVYSGTHETADDYIKRYLQKNAHKELLLISTDRMLGQWAKRLGVESLDSQDFYALLVGETTLKKAENKNSAIATKTTKAKNVELDVLMESETARVPRKQEDLIKERKSRAVHPSKKERALAKKINKL